MTNADNNRKLTSGPLDRLMRFCIENKLVVTILVLLAIGAGLGVAPFDWDLGIPRSPVPVDAIPDIGENQQIVFTEWPGRSPQDVEDQITYPLTVSLLGIGGVESVRSFSMFGFSSIYVIFEEGVEFYWSRSRVLEKLSSLPAGTVPEGTQPMLGPDSTALGQVYWYTLEGRDPQGNPAGGWDLEELRAIQDFNVRYALASAGGISEVASIGGFSREYQIDVNPDAMRAAGVGLNQIFHAVRDSNIDVGARTVEINRVEYVIRGLGFIQSLEDIEETVVAVNDNVPIRIKDVAVVSQGPALRRGALDKGGTEAVGGVVVVRHGYNPLEAIGNVKERIEEISQGLPSKTLEDGTVSQVTIVPFYDRTGLIYETLGTLGQALSEQILITIIVVVVTVMHLGSSLLISALLPLAVLMAFIAMRYFGVDANIVALSGIAIAIGTMVDMGIVMCENILSRVQKSNGKQRLIDVVHGAAGEVGSAVLTAALTTIVAFLPVFTMTGSEGKLFKPLAFTKTFAIIGSLVVALVVIPPAAHVLFSSGKLFKEAGKWLAGAILLVLAVVGFFVAWWAGVIILAVAGYHISKDRLGNKVNSYFLLVSNLAVALLVGIVLTGHWMPLGLGRGAAANFAFVALMIGSLLGFFLLFRYFYEIILGWCLRYKFIFLPIVAVFILAGASVWLGFGRIFSFMPAPIQRSGPYQAVSGVFPGLGREFLPPLDEGSYLLMPTTMPHASIGEAMDVLQKQDIAIQAIPEVESIVGKIGRAESPLDPAPISMVESVINYKSEYIVDSRGRPKLFRYDRRADRFVRDQDGELIADNTGRPYRQWREHIHSPDDIWAEIVEAAAVPGTTSAPKLQPIMARIVMLQTGMRAPMGVKVKGPDLETIEQVGIDIEAILQQVEGVDPQAVTADRIVGKPYLEIDINRPAIARHGISIRDIQDVIEVAIGGRRLTTTVEGRERYPVRVRYMRELRDSIEGLQGILVPAANGAQIPIIELADIRYVRGPMNIKSEDTALVSYVVFDKLAQEAEVDVVERAQAAISEHIATGQLELPAGVSYEFAGNYQHQLRAQRTLMVVVPVALMLIFLILYMQFRSVLVTLMVFSGIIVAWSGGFLMLWFYGQQWFMNFELFGENLRGLFNINPINLSVAIWVGFLALFGIASDDGVVMSTYMEQKFRDADPADRDQIRRLVISAAKRRVRPALMTTATTILALLPVLTSTGRGSDIMIPMAIPVFGGMLIEVLTILVVPVLYSLVKETKLRFNVG